MESTIKTINLRNKRYIVIHYFIVSVFHFLIGDMIRVKISTASGYVIYTILITYI